jgi:hypothetical protein
MQSSLLLGVVEGSPQMRHLCLGGSGEHSGDCGLGFSSGVLVQNVCKDVR